MIRKEEIKKAAFEYADTELIGIIDFKKEEAFIEGAKWADEHPKQIEISLEDIEELAKEVINVDWQERQDRLWNMIERNLRAQFIRKACKWLKEQSCCGYIEDTDVNEFIKQFRQAMKEE